MDLAQVLAHKAVKVFLQAPTVHDAILKYLGPAIPEAASPLA